MWGCFRFLEIFTFFTTDRIDENPIEDEDKFA